MTTESQMNTRAHTIGSAFPALNGKLRLYSMRFCPYSQRVRLILAAKNIPHEVVNVNPKKRPEWYAEINAQGQVPCLQHEDGRVIFESVIICDYLDSIYPQNKLMPTDPYQKAKHLMLIDGFQRVAGLLYKALKIKDKEAFNEINRILDSYERVLVDDFFGGKQPGFTDFMIWPWLERFRSLHALTNYEVDKDRFPKLRNMMRFMLQQAAVKANYTAKDHMLEYYRVLITNQEPDYDFGLPPPAGEGGDEAAAADAATVLEPSKDELESETAD